MTVSWNRDGMLDKPPLSKLTHILQQTRDLLFSRRSRSGGSDLSPSGICKSRGRTSTHHTSKLRKAFVSFYSLCARRTFEMTNVDLGGQYKRIMRLFWDPEPENNEMDSTPIWCLGQAYSNQPVSHKDDLAKTDIPPDQMTLRDEETDRDTVIVSRPDTIAIDGESNDTRAVPGASSSTSTQGWPEEFLDDFESRFWFTYRSQFTAIRKSTDPKATSTLSLGVRLRSQFVDQEGFTADTGWGCMIRSGQCVLANALAINMLGRDWRRGTNADKEKRIISLFADDPRAPYSLHRFVQHGEAACGKYPGEWFGPSATARCIEALVAKQELPGIKVYVTGDGADVYEDQMLELASSGGVGFTPVLLLVGTRLGIDRVNPVYWDALRQVFHLSQSLGIAGGRPSASHYFVGVQGDHFFYLDPHQTRPQLPYREDAGQYTEDEVNSCHTRRLRRLNMEAMDPSMLIAFLIKSRDDWEQWRASILNAGGKPVVHVADHKPPLGGQTAERAEAIDEVEILDDEEPADR